MGFQQFQQMAAKLSPAVVEKMLTAKPDSTGPEEEERRLWGFQEFQQFQQFQQMAALQQYFAPDSNRPNYLSSSNSSSSELGESSTQLDPQSEVGMIHV